MKVRICLLFALLGCGIGVQAVAQITAVAPEQSPPIPGAGHSYLHFLNETVNPANGSVDIKINVPVPAGRSLNLPFAFEYDSNAARHYMSTIGDNAAYLAQGGWEYVLPNLAYQIQSALIGPGSPPRAKCYTYSNYVFTDLNGVPHEPGLEVTPMGIASCDGENWPSDYLTLSDGAVQGSSPISTNSELPPPTTFTDADGTVYYFSNAFPRVHIFPGDGTQDKDAGAGFSTLPDYIEDRNGNKITFTDNGHGNVAVEDDLGRQVLTLNGFGVSGNTVTVSGLGAPYTLTWTNELFNFSVPVDVIAPSIMSSLTGYTCRSETGTSVNSFTGSSPEITELTLPNGQAYQFQYDPTYGLISKIIYPSGAYVRYVWGMTSSYSGEYLLPVDVTPDWSPSTRIPEGLSCEYLSESIVLLHRYVSFDGVHEVLQQDFSYATTLKPAISLSEEVSEGPFEDWSQKQTVVTTHDLVRGVSYTTNYTYVPAGPGVTQPSPAAEYTGVLDGMPLESNIETTDYDGKLVKNVAETYEYVYFKPEDKRVTLSNGQTSDVRTAYATAASTDGLQVATDIDYYDYGSASGSVANPGTPGALLKHVHADYASFPATPVGGIIADRPSDVVTDDGNGNRIAETDYSYDGASLTPVAASAHDDGNFPASYTSRGNLTSITRKCLSGCTANSVTSYTYDETGQVVSMTDPRGYTTTYSHADNPSGGNPAGNSDAYLTAITDPLKHTSSYSYNYTTGELASSTDEDGQTTNYTYNDPLNRLTEVQGPPDPSNGNQRPTTTYAYNDSAPSPSITTSTSISSSQSETKVAVMDGMGHVVQTQLTSDPQGTDYVTTTYDGEGRIFQVTNSFRSTSDPTYGVTTYTYDALGQKVMQTNPDGSTEQWCYDGIASFSGQKNCAGHLGSANGAWVDFTDEDGNHWQRTTDALGRLTGVVEDASGAKLETDYQYDALNNLLRVDQWGGPAGSSTDHVRSFTYDSLSRLLTSTNPESGTISYTYDPDGNVLSKTSPAPNGNSGTITTSYTYDPLNRVLSKISNDSAGTPTACYQYDQSSEESSNANMIGRLANEWTQSAGLCAPTMPTSGTLLTSKSILSYNPMGRVRNEQTCVYPAACTTAPAQYPLTFTYDLAGDATSYTNGNNSILFTNAYDGAGRLSSVSSSWNDATHPQCLFSAQTTASSPCTQTQSNPYSPFGGLTNGLYGNGVTINRNYDDRLRVAGETDTGNGGN